MKNVKPIRAERSDKALFRAMMGVFFLLFALAPAYWAFYNYGEYSRTTEFIKGLSENLGKNPSPEAGQEYSERITVFDSRASRYRLEMLLSGAGAFVLFGIAGLFFGKSFKSRGVKSVYQPLDTRTIPLPAARLEVERTIYQNFLLGGVVVFFGLLSALNFYQTLTSAYSSTLRIVFVGALALFTLGLVFALVFLMIRAKKMSVKSFDETGVTRGDGRYFAWTEFCGAVTQTGRRRFGGLYVWRRELVFSEGETAWIIPQRVKNYAEVFQYVNSLPQATPKN